MVEKGNTDVFRTLVVDIEVDRRRSNLGLTCYY